MFDRFARSHAIKDSHFSPVFSYLVADDFWIIDSLVSQESCLLLLRWR